MDNNPKLEHCHFGNEPCFHLCVQLLWLQTYFQISICPPTLPLPKKFDHVIKD